MALAPVLLRHSLAPCCFTILIEVAEWPRMAAPLLRSQDVLDHGGGGEGQRRRQIVVRIVHWSSSFTRTGTSYVAKASNSRVGR
jgi:hypothetical protein